MARRTPGMNYSRSVYYAKLEAGKFEEPERRNLHSTGQSHLQDAEALLDNSRNGSQARAGGYRKVPNRSSLCAPGSSSVLDEPVCLNNDDCVINIESRGVQVLFYDASKVCSFVFVSGTKRVMYRERICPCNEEHKSGPKFSIVVNMMRKDCHCNSCVTRCYAYCGKLNLTTKFLIFNHIWVNLVTTTFKELDFASYVYLHLLVYVISRRMTYCPRWISYNPDSPNVKLFLGDSLYPSNRASLVSFLTQHGTISPDLAHQVSLLRSSVAVSNVEPNVRHRHGLWPSKTTDVTKIKGWRSKRFHPEFLAAVVRDELESKGFNAELAAVYCTSVSCDPVMRELQEMATENERNPTSAFKSELLDRYLNEQSRLRVSYPVPRAFASGSQSSSMIEYRDGASSSRNESKESVYPVMPGTSNEDPTTKCVTRSLRVRDRKYVMVQDRPIRVTSSKYRPVKRKFISSIPKTVTQEEFFRSHKIPFELKTRRHDFTPELPSDSFSQLNEEEIRKEMQLEATMLEEKEDDFAPEIATDGRSRKPGVDRKRRHLSLLSDAPENHDSFPKRLKLPTEKEILELSIAHSLIEYSQDRAGDNGHLVNQSCLDHVECNETASCGVSVVEVPMDDNDIGTLHTSFYENTPVPSPWDNAEAMTTASESSICSFGQYALREEQKDLRSLTPSPPTSFTYHSSQTVIPYFELTPQSMDVTDGESVECVSPTNVARDHEPSIGSPCSTKFESAVSQTLTDHISISSASHSKASNNHEPNNSSPCSSKGGSAISQTPIGIISVSSASTPGASHNHELANNSPCSLKGGYGISQTSSSVILISRTSSPSASHIHESANNSPRSSKGESGISQASSSVILISSNTALSATHNRESTVYSPCSSSKGESEISQKSTSAISISSTTTTSTSINICNSQSSNGSCSSSPSSSLASFQVWEVLTGIVDFVVRNLEIPEFGYDSDLPATSDGPVVSKIDEKERKSKTEREIMKLVNVSVVDEALLDSSTVTDGQSSCGNEFCRKGCVCNSLDWKPSGLAHCGKSKCIFSCSCPLGKLIGSSEFDSSLAREEQTWHQTFIKRKDKGIELFTRTSEKSKRETKLPQRFLNHVVGKDVYNLEKIKVFPEPKKKHKIADVKDKELPAAQSSDSEDTGSEEFNPWLKKSSLEEESSDASSLAEDNAFEDSRTLRLRRLKFAHIARKTHPKLLDIGIWCAEHNRYNCLCLNWVVMLKNNSLVWKPHSNERLSLREMRDIPLHVSDYATDIFVFDPNKNCSRTYGRFYDFGARNASKFFKTKLNSELDKYMSFSNGFVKIKVFMAVKGKPKSLRPADEKLRISKDCKYVDIEKTDEDLHVDVVENAKPKSMGGKSKSNGAENMIDDTSSTQSSSRHRPASDTGLINSEGPVKFKSLGCKIKAKSVSKKLGSWPTTDSNSSVIASAACVSPDFSVSSAIASPPPPSSVPRANASLLPNYPSLSPSRDSQPIMLTPPPVEPAPPRIKVKSISELTSPIIKNTEEDIYRISPSIRLVPLNQQPFELDSSEKRFSFLGDKSETLTTQSDETLPTPIEPLPASIETLPAQSEPHPSNSGTLPSTSNELPEHALVCLKPDFGYLRVLEFCPTRFTLSDPENPDSTHVFTNIEAASFWLNRFLKQRMTFCPTTLTLQWIMVKRGVLKLKGTRPFDPEILKLTNVVQESDIIIPNLELERIPKYALKRPVQSTPPVNKVTESTTREEMVEIILNNLAPRPTVKTLGKTQEEVTEVILDRSSPRTPLLKKDSKNPKPATKKFVSPPSNNAHPPTKPLARLAPRPVGMVKAAKVPKPRPATAFEDSTHSYSRDSVYSKNIAGMKDAENIEVIELDDDGDVVEIPTNIPSKLPDKIALKRRNSSPGTSEQSPKKQILARKTTGTPIQTQISVPKCATDLVTVPRPSLLIPFKPNVVSLPSSCEPKDIFYLKRTAVSSPSVLVRASTTSPSSTSGQSTITVPKTSTSVTTSSLSFRPKFVSFRGGRTSGGVQIKRLMPYRPGTNGPSNVRTVFVSKPPQEPLKDIAISSNDVRKILPLHQEGVTVTPAPPKKVPTLIPSTIKNIILKDGVPGFYDQSNAFHPLKIDNLLPAIIKKK